METDYNKTEFKSLRRKLRTGQTEAETRLWRYLRKRQMCGQRFLRQFGFRNYILDFYCPDLRICIELDGGQHANPDAVEYDRKRTELLEMHNIKVLRFWNNEVFNNIVGVLEVIGNEVRRTPPSLPLCQGEESY